MSEVPVAWTKIVVPGRREDLVRRQRLIDLFYDLLDNRLIIVAAPAGYGKTTLLVDFSRELEIPTCWLSLDELDRSPRRFLATFIAAISRQFPAFGRESSATLQEMSAEVDWDRMIITVVNDAYQHIGEHFLLVIDDYHYVDDNHDIVYFINQLVQQVDENWHVVLATRKLPALPDLPLMVARSLVGGLGFQMLAFQREELQELLLQNHGLTIQDVEAHRLLEQTEGWITGLLLSAQTMEFQLSEQGRLQRLVGVSLHDYLAQQVLSRQTEAMQQFLLYSSLLDAFNAELCAAVLEPASYLRTRSWQWFIDDAVRRNLFIQPVDDKAGWVRYHQLFQAFLRRELESRHAEKARQIRGQLASVYSQQGDWERAYQLYHNLGEVMGVAALIERVGSRMIRAGRQQTLSQWLDSLPADLLETRPELLSLQGTVAIDLGEAERGVGYLNAAHAVALEMGDDAARADVLVRRAWGHRSLGNEEMAYDDAQTAWALLGEGEGQDEVRANASRVLALLLSRIGQTDEAIKMLEEAQKLQRRRRDTYMVAMNGMVLGHLYQAVGARTRARGVLEESLRYWREQGNIAVQANAFNNLGTVAQELGQYEEAGSLFEEAIALAERQGLKQHIALAKASIGDIYTELDAFEAAEQAYLEARTIAVESDYRFLQQYLAVATAAIARRQGDYGRAKRLLWRSTGGARSASWHLEWGQLAAATGQVEMAISALQEAILYYENRDKDKYLVKAWLALAASYRQAERGQEALFALEKAIKLALPTPSHVTLVAAREQREFLVEVAAESEGPSGVAVLIEAMERFEKKIPSLRRALRRKMAVVPFAPPQLRIQILGETEVSLGTTRITRSDWQTPMAPLLLFLLLEHPDGLAKEDIGLYLWPDYSPGRLKVNFQKTIYRLRRALLPDVVVYDEETNLYYFNRDLDYTCDVERFRLHLMEARTTSNVQEQIAAYRAALELYQGPYLSDQDEIWAGPTRAALAEAYHEAALELAELYLNDGAFKQVLALSRRLLEEDPCMEAAYRLAMQAHAGRGNMAGVVRQYERCEQVLEEEIRVAPSPHTIELYRRLTSPA